MKNNKVISTVKIQGSSIIVEYNYEGEVDTLKVKNEPTEYSELLIKLYSLDFLSCLDILPEAKSFKKIYENAIMSNFINLLMKRVLPNIDRFKFYDFVIIDDLIKFIDKLEEKGYDLNVKRSGFNDINIFTMLVLSFMYVQGNDNYEKLKKLYYHLFYKPNIDKSLNHMIFGNALDIFKNEITDEQCKDRLKMMEDLTEILNK